MGSLPNSLFLLVKNNEAGFSRFPFLAVFKTDQTPDNACPAQSEDPKRE
jgi:hypothetical protein